jgi:hypothetical protein
MDKDTSLFFTPRQVMVQARLPFLSIPPMRVVAFPIEALDFTGLNLHGSDAGSAVCNGTDTCEHCFAGDKPRPYFYSPCYLWAFSTKSFKRFVLPIGMYLDEFAESKLVGAVWEIHPKLNDKRKKKGLFLRRTSLAIREMTLVQNLVPFDVTPRLAERFHLS